METVSTNPPTDEDSPWKESLDEDFPGFLQFFFDRAHRGIDWSHNWDALEQEFRKLAPTSEVGKRIADKLVKVMKTSGDESYIHVELQGQRETDFENRVYTYHYRCKDHYGKPPASMVILLDDDPIWNPSRYRYEEFGCRNTFKFKTVKILSYAGKEEQLLKKGVLFGYMVVAQLYALRTKQDPQSRATLKLDLLKRLIQRPMETESKRRWYRLVDWLLPLPEALELQVNQQLRQVEEGTRMPFMSYPERVGFEKGMTQGKSEGLVQGLLHGLETALEVKFGTEAEPLLARLRKQTDPVVLEQVRAHVKSATSIDQLARLLP